MSRTPNVCSGSGNRALLRPNWLRIGKYARMISTKVQVEQRCYYPHSIVALKKLWSFSSKTRMWKLWEECVLDITALLMCIKVGQVI